MERITITTTTTKGTTTKVRTTTITQQRHDHPCSCEHLMASSSSTSFRRSFSKIKHWLEHHPIAANSILCLNLWVAGDVLAQYSEHNLLHNNNNNGYNNNEEKKNDKAAASLSSTVAVPHTIDWVRTIQCASYGGFVSGPLLAVWYPYLDTLCQRWKITSRYGLWGAPILKCLADEFLMDPPCLLMFYGYMNVCEGGDFSTYQQKVKSEFLTSWFTSLAVWPVVLLGTFRFVPVYAQAPIINVCCIVWDGFLSHRNAVAKSKEQQQQQLLPPKLQQ